MQTRPSTVYIKRKCVKRRSLRSTLVFIGVLLLLLSIEVDTLLALIIAGAVMLSARYWLARN
ncbi:MAG: hypothetical protein RR232_01370 [Clostridia bacterium]